MQRRDRTQVKSPGNNNIEDRAVLLGAWFAKHPEGFNALPAAGEGTTAAICEGVSFVLPPGPPAPPGGICFSLWSALFFRVCELRGAEAREVQVRVLLRGLLCTWRAGGEGAKARYFFFKLVTQNGMLICFPLDFHSIYLCIYLFWF